MTKMCKWYLGGAIICILLLAIANVRADVTDSIMTINAHNVERNKLNSGGFPRQPVPNPFIPDLIWDQGLAESADTHSQKCVWKHSGTGGENLYAHSGRSGSIKSAVGLWVAEEKDYHYDTVGSKQNGVVGHYTQVMWSSTTRVGCAKHYCNPIVKTDGTNLFTGEIITCQYRSSGNWVGRYPYSIDRLTGNYAHYESDSRNFNVSNINVNDKYYRVKFDYIEGTNPSIFDVVAFALTDGYKDENWNQFLSYYDTNQLIVEQVTLDDDPNAWDVEFKHLGDLKFKLEKAVKVE